VRILAGRILENYGSLSRLSIFKSLEDMQKGLQAHDPALAADMVNYTDAKPKFQVSEIIG
jgi:hypothetical protein